LSVSAGDYKAQRTKINLLLHFLSRRFAFAFFNTFSKRLLTLAQGFRQLREPGGAKQQKDHEDNDYKLGGSESRDRQKCLIHDSSFYGAAQGLAAILDRLIRRTNTFSTSRQLCPGNALSGGSHVARTHEACATGASRIPQESGFPFDDCNACSRQPDYPTRTPLRASVAAHGRVSVPKADIECRNTGRSNGRAAECSSAIASDVQKVCGCIPSNE